MLSYQHDYHAGNHADVLKHVVLSLLIRSLERKPAPLRIIDTHAGSGRYDLDGSLAQRHREHEHGIARVLLAARPSEHVRAYLDVIAAANPDGRLRTYPGSPEIAYSLSREQDHIELFELHPGALRSLSARFGNDRRVHLHRRDAFEGVPAVLPPRERRGLVLIDPAYESDAEYPATLRLLHEAVRRWSAGVYAVWYPLLRKRSARRFVASLEALELPRLFQVELAVAGPGAVGLRGSGVVIANLPFEVDRQLTEVVPWLQTQLAPEHGACRARWLTAP